MKVLVVGGAGYIGSHITKALVRVGHQTTVFDNLSTGRRENVFPGAEFICGDILSPDEINAAAKGMHAIVHLAAKKAVGESMSDPGKYAVNNISGTINLLNAAVANGVDKFIFSSSATVYGDPRYLPIDEKHPITSINFYGYTKVKTEELMGWYSQLKGLKYAALRYFNAVGYDVDGEIHGLESDPQNLFPIVFEAVMGWRDKVVIFGDDYDTPDGTGIRDYIHVSDLADGHIKALDYLAAKNENLIVNLASGQGISVKEAIDAVKRESGVDFQVEIGPRRPGDQVAVYADASKAKELLGWEAKYSDLDTIVKTTLKAYEKNRKN